MNFSHDYTKYEGKECISNFTQVALSILDKFNIKSDVIPFLLFSRMNNGILYYHTPAHVLAGFQFLHNWGKNAPEYSDVQLLAWLFHDAVYLPGAAHEVNERESFEFFKREMSIFNFSKEQLDGVESAIMATAHFFSEEDFGDNNLILDLDMHNIGSDYECFSRASDLIRKEFQHVPDKDFMAGRKKFFEGMLKKKSIFRTPKFYSVYENKARENLERGLKELEDKK